MRETILDYRDGIIKGLRPTNLNSSESPYLIKAEGLFPQANKVLASHPDSPHLDLDFLGCEFPYPQVFVTSLLFVVCTQTMIFEVIDLVPSVMHLTGTSGQLTGVGGKKLVTAKNLLMKLANLTPGELWTIADFQSYLVLNNGVHNVVRDPVTGLYSIDEGVFPKGSCIAASESQLFVGAAGTTRDMFNIDRTGFTNFNSAITHTTQLGGSHD